MAAMCCYTEWMGQESTKQDMLLRNKWPQEYGTTISMLR